METRMRTRIIKGSFVALCAAIFLAVFVMTNPSNVSAAENISMTVSDFTVSPSVVDEGTFVTIDYRIDATYTGTSGGYFKNGQVTKVDTNLYDYFDGGAFTEPVHHAVTDEVVGEISYKMDEISITWNSVAEAYRMTHYTGTFSVEYEFKAMDINSSNSPLTKEINIGEATCDVTWKAKPIYLSKSKSGQGTISPASTVEFTGNTERTSITATPSVGETVLSVVLTKSDGSQESINVSPEGGSFIIYKSGLTIGNNRVHVAFSDSSGGQTPTPVDPTEPDEYQKRIADAPSHYDYEGSLRKKVSSVIDNKYAPFTISINHSLFTPLFAAKDDNSLFPSGGKLKGLYFWDEIPVDASFNFDSPSDGGIYAVLPYYKENRYGYPVPVDGNGDQGWYRMVDVRPYLTAVIQEDGESLSSFWQRFNAAELPAYAIYTGSDGKPTIQLKLGDNDSGSLKYSDVFSDELFSDSTYYEVFGDDNPLNGTIQCYVIKYSDDHSRQTWGGTYKNLAQLNYPRGDGSTGFRQANQEYNIRGSKSRVQGSGGDFEMYYYDEETGEGIQGGEFALEKKADGSGEYEPYTINGEQLSGLTADEDGYLMLQNLIPGDYRLVKKNTVDGYENSTTSYKAGPGNNGTNMSGNSFTVKADAQASVVMLVGENRDLKFNVYYNANGGTGDLEDDNNPYKPGNLFKVLSPSGQISRTSYYFTGWNDKEDGSGTTYAVNSSNTMPAHDITLYAQWSRKNKAELDSPDITKVIETDDTLPEKSETFGFTIAASDNNPDVVTGLGTSASIEGSGTISNAFGSGLEFTEAGEYTFAIRETAGSAEGYTYDDTVHEWKVVVGSDNYNYIIQSNTIDGVDVVDGGAVAFTNTYTVPVEEFTITYDLNGGNWKGDTADIKEVYPKGTRIKIHAAPERNGYTFTHWEGSVYQPNESYIVEGDHTFTAQWAKNTDPTGPTVRPTDPTDLSTTPTDPDDPAKDRSDKKDKSSSTGDDTPLLLHTMILLTLSVVCSAVFIRRRQR